MSEMKVLAIQKEYACPYYSEEDDLSCGVMLKCFWDSKHVLKRVA